MEDHCRLLGSELRNSTKPYIRHLYSEMKSLVQYIFHLFTVPDFKLRCLGEMLYRYSA